MSDEPTENGTTQQPGNNSGGAPLNVSDHPGIQAKPATDPNRLLAELSAREDAIAEPSKEPAKNEVYQAGGVGTERPGATAGSEGNHEVAQQDHQIAKRDHEKVEGALERHDGTEAVHDTHGEHDTPTTHDGTPVLPVQNVDHAQERVDHHEGPLPGATAPTVGTAPIQAVGDDPSGKSHHELEDGNRDVAAKTLVPSTVPGETHTVSDPNPDTHAEADASNAQELSRKQGLIAEPGTEQIAATHPDEPHMTETVTPRLGEQHITEVEDPRAGTRTPLIGGGDPGGGVHPATAGQAVVGASAPTRVLGVPEATRSPALVRPQPMAGSDTTRLMTPVVPAGVPLPQGEDEPEISDIRVPDGDVGVTGGAQVTHGDPYAADQLSIVPGTVAAHAAMMKGDLRNFPRDDLGLAGSMTQEGHAEASTEVAERAQERDLEMRQHRDDIIANQAVENAVEAEDGPVVTQRLNSGYGTRVIDVLNPPSVTGSTVNGQLVAPPVEYEPTEGDYTEDEAGQRIYGGPSGSAAPIETTPNIKDWAHAPNLPADPNPPNADQVVHAPGRQADNGGL